MAAQDIIIRPIITEKTMDGTTQKKYTFEVDKKSTKIDVKRAVEELFGVKVQKVNTLHVRGRMRRQGRILLLQLHTIRFCIRFQGHPHRGQQDYRVLREHGLAA